MKCVVINDFRDKYSGNICLVGKELELTKKRFEEINSTASGILVKVAEEETEEVNAEANEGEKQVSTSSTGENEGADKEGD